MKKIKKNNLFKYLIPSIVAVLVAGTIASVVSINEMNATNYNNILNNTSSFSDNTNSLLVDNNQQKVASNDDFLLNSSNAINLSSPANPSATSLSVTNGPRGFLSVVGGYITYTGYDGNEIWKKIEMIEGINTLIASYYQADAKSFVILYSISYSSMRVITLRESDGAGQKSNTDFSMFGNVQRHLMFPIYDSTTNAVGNSYMIMSQSKQLSTQRNINVVRINSDGSVTHLLTRRFDDKNANASHVILSASSINHATSNNTYSFLLCQYGNGQIVLRTYENYVFKQEIILDASFATSFDDINIDNNIPEIWLSMGGMNSQDNPGFDPIIHIVAVLNTDVSKTKMIRGYYWISLNEFKGFEGRTVNLQQPGVLDYDIYRGRFYGNYFYAYLGYTNYNNGEPKIMRLNLSWNGGQNWSTSGFQWSNNYNDPRIILYDSPYFLSTTEGTIQRFNQIIALPFYTTNYDEKPNLFTVATYDNSLSSNLYLLDGTKAAYAYKTRLKDNSTSIINIPGVHSEYVKDVSESVLRKHLSNYGLMTKHFTQYQTGSNYTVVKKTSPADIIKNYQGIIPITYTILNGYDNNVVPDPSSKPVNVSFELELTGFKAAATIVNENPDVSLPSSLSNLLPGDVIVSNTDLKKYVWDNSITDPTPNAISINDLTISSIKSFNNITGEIKLQILLKKFYNASGILVTNYTYPNLITIKGFTQVNPTTLKTTTLTTNRQVYASAQNPTLLQEIIFDRREDIFANNSIPNNFTKTNIVNVSIVANSVNDKTGVLQVTFELNNYYDNSGILTTSPNKSFGPLTINGFLTVNKGTTIKTTPTISSVLNGILAQDITNLSNAAFKEYLWTNVVTGTKDNMTSNDITGIRIKSFNNLTGTLILSSITLNKYWDHNNSLLVNASNEFIQDITIDGFKKAVPTTLKTNQISITTEQLASQTTTANVAEIISNKKLDIFTNKSIPENLLVSNIINISIIQNSVNDKTGMLQVTFELNNYYDNSGILTTSPNKSFGPLTISGFKSVNKETTIRNNPAPSATLANILAQDITNLSNAAFKEYLWTNVVTGTKDNMTSSNITSINVKSFDNLTGTLILSSITLNKYWDSNTSLLVDKTKTFTQDIAITGFKLVVETSINNSVDSKLNSILASAATIDNLIDVIFNQRNQIFVDKGIPTNFLKDNIKNVTIIPGTINDKTGVLQATFELNNYYNNSGILTTSPNKSFGPLTISGFKSVNKETTIRNNPAPSATLANILAQDITNLSNAAFKEYLWTNVVTGTKDNMTSSNITSINVKSFDNLTGTLILSSITLNKYWDSNTSLLVDKTKTFTQDIAITGFKLVVETSINNSVDSKLNSILASAATIDNLIDVIFNQRNQIFIDKGIPTNFLKDNIKNVTIIPGTINDKTGVLQATFELNNYYNNSGILITSPNKSFGPLTIEGFLNLNKETTIGYISQIPSDNPLANILAQDITNLSNAAFKEYLWTNVVTGTKDNMTSSNITSINVKSFDNLTGTLILSSITLNKYWDSNTSLLVDATKTFDTQDIEISGFKAIEATDLQRTSFVFSELNQIKASNMKDNQLQALLFGARNRIFLNKSLPDDFVQNNILNYNIVPGSANDTSGTLRVNFQINNYYKIGNGEWIKPGTGPVLEFNNITFAGFLKSGLGTVLSPSQNAINLTDTFPYQITNPIADTTLKQFIFDHIIADQNKNLLSVNDITAITLDPVNPYDNKQGILKIQSITLSKWHEDNGTLTTGTRIFSLENNATIEIQGFKKVSGYTTNVTTKVNVSGELVNLTTTEVTVEQLKVWAQNNLSSLFTNLVSVPTTTNVVSVEKANSLISTGELHVNITLNQFYENNNDFSYQKTNKKFTNIILGGFLNKSLATTTKNPTVGVSGTLAGLLPQQIDEDKNNNDFKNYLISNVIVDPTNNLTASNITTFTGSYDNLTGEYTLTSITLNKSYDKDGKLVNAPITFRNFSYVITGFKNISGATSKIPDAFIDASAPDIFADAVTKAQYTQIIKDNYLTVITNLPSSFTKDNIVNVDLSTFDNDLGYLYVDVTINKYYAANGKLMDGNFLLSNILISGYKVNSTIPEITINNRVAVTLYNSVYHRDIAGNIVTSNNVDSINLITNWLRTDAIFNLVVSNPKGLSKNDFNVSKINSIDNLTGEVAVTISVKNGTIEPNKNVLTFYGFKKPIPVESWIESIGEIKGIATTNETKIDDIKKQILSLANTNNSPFTTLVKETDISIVVDPQDNNKFIITINNNSYVNAKGDLVRNTVELKSTYVINTISSSENNDWIWILIYSLAGVIAFALLLWIIIAIIKRNKRNGDIEDDDFAVS